MKGNLAWHFTFCREAFGLVPTLFWFVARPILDLLRPSIWHFYRMDKGFKLPPKQGVRVMLVAADCTPASGAFRCCVGLAKTLREYNHLDAFVVIPGHDKGEELLKEAGIPYLCVPIADWVVYCTDHPSAEAQIARFVRNVLAVRHLRQLIRKFDVDIVHCNTVFTYAGALAAHLERRPVVWHIRESLVETGNYFINKNRSCELVDRSNAVLCVSEWIKREFQPHIPTANMIAVHDGVDYRRFYNDSHDVFMGKPYTFVMLGNFQPKKCQLEFSRACVALYKQGVRDFRLWFVGGKGIQEKCGPILDAGGLHDSVTYWGFQKNPEKIIQEADVAFMCSRAEAFGLVTVEAMLSGCLVIGSNTAGTPELIHHGETGLLFEFAPDECPDLVEKMRYAVEHPEEARRMAAAGREYMRQHKTLEVNADKVAEVYRQIRKA